MSILLFSGDKPRGGGVSRDQSRHSQISSRPGLCLRCHSRYEIDSRDHGADILKYLQDQGCITMPLGMREIPGTRADIHKYLQGQGYVYDVTVGMREIPGPRAAIHKCLQDL